MNGDIVIDASIALKWVMEEEYFERARELLALWSNTDTRLLAPALLGFELTNALNRRVHRGEFTEEQAYIALNDLMNSGIDMTYDSHLHYRALELSRQFNRPSSYDSHYLALAEREGCEFWTADERLWNSVKSELTWARWIGEPDGV